MPTSLRRVTLKGEFNQLLLILVIDLNKKKFWQLFLPSYTLKLHAALGERERAMDERRNSVLVS